MDANRTNTAAQPSTALPEASDRSSLLELVDVCSGYGEIEVLKGVSYTVRERDLVCIIGRNGAGKSTLLKTIFGHVRLSSGNVRFAGEDVSGRPPAALIKRGVTFCPQGRCNFPEMTVRENLEMGAYSRNDRAVNQDIEQMMERFSVLGRKRNTLAGNLSGGEQQILEMASALLLHPRLFLVDEPSLGLSPAMVSQTFATIKEINQDGTTILMVEQNAKKALEISSRAIILDLGTVRMEGPAKEIRENPDVKHLFLGE